MRADLALGLLLWVAGQAPETPDSIQVVLARVQRRLTERALAGESTVLAHDRAVTVLVDRMSDERAQVVDARRRLDELAFERRVLESIPAGDLTDEARVRHLERLERLELARVDGVRSERLACRALAGSIGELKGRVEGKVDTLVAATETCRRGEGPPWCAGLEDALEAYRQLSQAVARSKTEADGLCR